MQCPLSYLIIPKGTHKVIAQVPGSCGGTLPEDQAQYWEEAASEELLCKLQNSHDSRPPVLTGRLHCGCSFLVAVPIWTFTEMAAKAASSRATEPWSSHPVYARYWQHYHQAMAWMRSHQNAYRKAVESYFSTLWYSPPAALAQSSYANESGSPQSFYDHHSASQDSCCGYLHAGRSGRHLYDSTREDQAWSAEEELETESDGGVECDVSNMEITEELRQYFAETERHREERRRQQQLEAARLADYVNADHDLCYNPRRSREPPAERPGERRQAEMQRLYGDSAAKIQAMEAAVQLSFDKHCDRKQPKYWPVIPLKF